MPFRFRNIYKEVIEWNSIVFVYQYWHLGRGCLSNHDDASKHVKSILIGGEKWKRKMDLQY